MAVPPEGLNCWVEESNAEMLENFHSKKLRKKYLEPPKYCQFFDKFMRGTTEPFLRLHNLYPSPRCASQAALPRLSRKVASQHSHQLNRFSSVPLDPMERPTSQADLELYYNPPHVQLGEEMFVFQEGRWVNENCLLKSPYFSPSSSFHHKRLAKEYLLLDKNWSLREENRALREENKTLRTEKKILQVFLEEQKLPPGCEDGRASLLRKDSAALEAAKKDPALQGHRSKQSSTLQLLRVENRALQQLLEQRKIYWALTEEKTGPVEESNPPPSPDGEPRGSGLLTDPGQGLPSAVEEPKVPLSLQEDPKTLHALREMVSSLAGSTREERTGAGPGPGLADNTQPPDLLREMSRALQALLEESQSLQALREETLHALREEHRLFQEERKALWENKLKLQQKLIIDTVTQVTARMEMLIEELYSFLPTKNKDPKKPPRV